MKTFSYTFFTAFFISISCLNLYAADSEALFYAVEDPAKLSSLLATGINPNTPDANSDTVLMYAAMFNPESVRVLLAMGAHPNTQNRDGDTPLMLAAQHNQVESAKALIDAGAEPNVKNKKNKMALDFARELGDKRLTHYLEKVMGDRANKCD